ncbi:glycosyltransferase [Amorphus orientalis]|uniref:Glycosyltransferase involved in cell wall biosynthesis n=1 Tax=Amorphus orientalis TaxID=649198 RepID=A0AAE4ATW5_9HYPH|nr:glycosyltransferase [Amorphus orientalis]MDQ0316542.1 glycosyltransferase involved in cell wall biosynthesis [Amorphus orientalis]
MLSVIIPTHNSEFALARCLAALVPGAIDGVVSEVIVADRASTDGTAKVADAAGCRLIAMDQPREARIEAGIAAIERGSWVLVLEPTVSLEPGWQNEVGAFIERTERAGRAGEQTAVFRFAFDEFVRPRRLSQAYVALRGHFLGLPVPEQGLLANRQALTAALAGKKRGRSGGLDGVISWRRLSVLRSRALVHPEQPA